jgi:hypothetical protein
MSFSNGAFTRRSNGTIDTEGNFRVSGDTVILLDTVRQTYAKATISGYDLLYAEFLGRPDDYYRRAF